MIHISIMHYKRPSELPLGSFRSCLLTLLVLIPCFLVSRANDHLSQHDTDDSIEYKSENGFHSHIAYDEAIKSREGKGSDKIPVTASPAFIVIDVQNCFLPGGAIPVAGGNDIIPVINNIRQSFNWRMIAFSKDWHCENHISFVTQHPNSSSPVLLTYVNQTKKAPELCHTEGSGIFEPTVACPDREENPSHYLAFNQTLWPPHCVVNTDGAKLAKTLHFDDGADFVIKKGTLCQIDSYSAFEDNGGMQKTELRAQLKEMRVDTVFIAGLTLDYCVKFTALDARKYGFATYVILDATKATNDKVVNAVIAELETAGVKVVLSTELAKIGLRRQAPKILSLIFAIPLAIVAALLIIALIIFLRAPKREPLLTEDNLSGPNTEEDRKPLLLE